jgi:transcription elongation factor GreA
MEEREYLTREKYEMLAKELTELKTVKRKEVADALDYARGLGDLSENAEYHEAREAQANLEDKIKKLDALLKNASVFEDKHTDRVMIGSTVTVKNEATNQEKTIKIVGSEESDTAQGKISNKSPMGSAVLGKKKDEAFSFTTPAGTMKYKVVSIK